MLVLSVSARIFSVFACESFGADDATRATVSFLASDYAVECDTEAHDALRWLATGLIVLWPVGVPTLFAGLLIASRRRGASKQLVQAVGFLHAEYASGCHMWELLELVRKLALTGFVFLIPQERSLLRLLLAILVSIGHVVVLQQAAPYKQASTAFVAVAASVLLLCTLLVAMLVKMYDELPIDQLKGFFGFESALPLAAVIFGFNLSVLAVTLAIAVATYRGQSARWLRLTSTGEAVQVSAIGAEGYHVFLSHAWISGQDQMRVVKQRLLEMLPGVRVFLDVDDLQGKQGTGATFVAASSTVLVGCSHGYFGGNHPASKPCIAELLTAIALGKPLIALIEVEDKHQPLTRAQLRAQMAALDAPQRTAADGQEHRSMYAQWNLLGQLVEAFGPAPHTPPVGEQMYGRVFAHEPIEWNRLGSYQDVSLRLIAERLIGEEYAGKTYLPGELREMPSRRMPSPSAGRRFHVCCSRHNRGALELMREIESSLGLRLQLTSDIGDAAVSERFLVYLNASTWRAEPAAFTRDVEAAMEAGARVLLVHEAPGMDDPEVRGALPFANLLAVTPPHLLRPPNGQPGIYRMIAIALKAGAWRKASHILVARELASGIGVKVAAKLVRSVTSAWQTGRALVSRAEEEEVQQLSRGGRLIVGRLEVASKRVRVHSAVEGEGPHERL